MRTFLAALVLLAACTDPDMTGRDWTCNESHDCSADHVCIEEVCTSFYEYSVIIDNRDAGFHLLSGDWTSCDCQACGGLCYGDDFLYAEPGCLTCAAEFVHTFSTEGTYRVWLWWPESEDRATDAAVVLTHANGQADFRIDLSSPGSRWHELGSFDFFFNETYSLIVNGHATGFVNADAVMFELLPP